MAMTQRRELTSDDEQALRDAATRADTARDDYKRLVVTMLAKSSYSAVNAITGISTATLQKWKRELTQD